MGARGPRPTPKNILRMRGSWRGKAEPDEVTAPDGTPLCPHYLKDAARREWKRIIPIVSEMGVISVADVNLLARYCTFQAQWRACIDFIAQHGATRPSTDARGKVIGLEYWPQANMLLALNDKLLRIEHEFGLTPAARAGLKAPAKAKEAEPDGKARFFATA